MNISIKRVLSLLLAMMGWMTFVACDDDDDSKISVNEGVVFTLTRKLVYTTGVNEIGSIKVTLSDGHEKIVLPSLSLRGNEEIVRSEPCALAAGDYRIVAYTAYSTRHEFLFDAELDSKNEFTVNANEVIEFKIPIKTKEILNYNFLRNSLMGLCKAVFGDDEASWPWNPKKYPYPDWEGLEFELDDYGSPMYLSGISFEGVKNGKETPWIKMEAIPEGTLSNIAELATINVSDIPGFRHLPSDLDRLPALQQISCINTGLEELPANISSLTTLSGIFLINCQVEKFDYDLSALQDLRVLSLAGNSLKEISPSLSHLPRLVSLDLSHNPLNALEESLFKGKNQLNQLNLSHTALTTLPASLASVITLRGLDLSSCQFTEVPDVLNHLPHLKSLSLDSNQLVKVSVADFEGMTDLECLSLAGNALGGLPALNNKALAWLDVHSCGMTQVPDLTGYPELRVLLMGNNPISTLPEYYFSSNQHLTIFNLSHSEKLTALPEDLGLVPADDKGNGSLRLVELQHCPNLHWITPAAWQAYDFNHSNDWVFSLEEGVIDSASDASDATDEKGYVGVKRSGSPFVKFGN